jgi:hypothetical protein
MAYSNPKKKKKTNLGRHYHLINTINNLTYIKKGVSAHAYMLDSVIRDWLEPLSLVPLEPPAKASGVTVDISMGDYYFEFAWSSNGMFLRTIIYNFFNFGVGGMPFLG